MIHRGATVAELKVGNVNVTLYPNDDLLHPNFVLLERHDNGSAISIPDFKACHFRTSSNSPLQIAADLCDGIVSEVRNKKN